MTKRTKTKTGTTRKQATVVAMKKKAPKPGVCMKCGFKLSGHRTRCRVPAACAKRQKAAA